MDDPLSDRLVFAIPGDLSTPSGGYGYDRRLIEELREAGWQVDHLALPADFPFPDERALEETRAAFAELPDNALVLIDGLAFGAMPDIALAECERLRLVALIHHPLGFEAGLDAVSRDRLLASERRALTAPLAIVVTSPATKRTLVEEFGVSETDVTVALPGTRKPAADSDGRREREVADPHILAIGTIIERKDHATLVKALAQIADRAWCCTIVGNDQAEPETANALRDLVDTLGLADRILIHGAAVDVESFYRQADIFALASRYEGYGMVFAEALVHGLPIVACRGGAIPDVVPESAGILVEPGDVDAFADALRSLLDEPERRAQLSASGRAEGMRLPDWSDTARIVADLLKEFRR
ncbi:Glycosyl transferases group 1 [Fulvimarina manganoxydans]|uniref:Glycosyl transferases group 1 n=1 Tax=Fulvimarina manganoxydans TaxID=937218 RepID=A0A1W2CRT6_9HYPH|nr:glycosyltransferase family 4 protein [Fulvimarina manganoxydans]SMC87921.1 Glycosyl transferases group 1 [Fulvimarina manganoxydans]